MRKKWGWTVLGILGLVYLPLGLLFVTLGLVLGNARTLPWSDPRGANIFLYVFCGVGGVFALLGLVFTLRDLRRRHRLRLAYTQGSCVEAEIIGITPQNNVKINNAHPYVLECAYTDPYGTVHTYRSRYLRGDAAAQIQSPTVPVYVDRLNPGDGFVDVDAILPDVQTHG